MRVGAVLPQIEIAGDVGKVRAFAAAVDDLGFDHLLGYDHVLGAEHTDRDPALVGPYDQHDPFHDPLVLFAHLAALHPRLEYVTGILILPQRQTALAARQAADLAMLATGGVRLGVAVGWNWTEYDALGQDFADRGVRLDEQIPLLRRLWRGGPVTATIGDEHFERVALVPAPPAPPPVWVGGFSEPAYRRGAALGDGFVFAGPTARATAGWERSASCWRRRTATSTSSVPTGACGATRPTTSPTGCRCGRTSGAATRPWSPSGWGSGTTSMRTSSTWPARPRRSSWGDRH